ncbi:AI-2E family transporter [Marinilongibacter aquaticus]|uniref:AI-2E family transporter n=1 Tax=Marinilongibacter aquaticus TaxID=2975157 RepID=UPI0021BDC76C|nr:AI-2E family transporter [Marinilongibacter aquaticus]UBM60087.1 AI-2E family transporter [Marinilongibacter aquaticus]
MVKKVDNSSIKLAASLISLVIVIYIMNQLQEILVPLIFAGIFSVLLLPLCSFLERIRLPRVLAIVVTIVLAIAVVAAVIALVVGQIRSLDEVWPMIATKSGDWLKSVQDFATSQMHIKESELLGEIRKYLSDALKSSGSLISGTVSSTTGFLANLTLIPLYTFLMLLYRDFFLEFLYKLFSKLSQHRIDLVVSKIKSVLQSYMSGLMLVILIIGTLNTIALLLLGIPHGVFFGFFAAVLVLIPYIGIAIGSLLPILMALIMKDSIWYAVGVAASFAAIQFLEGNFITPYVVGSKVSINSFAAIVSLLLFSSLWGMSGLVLALPLTAIIKVLFDSTSKLKPWGYLLGESED